MKSTRSETNIATLWLIGWSLHMHIKTCDPPHTVELPSCIRLADMIGLRGEQIAWNILKWRNRFVTWKRNLTWNFARYWESQLEKCCKYFRQCMAKRWCSSPMLGMVSDVQGWVWISLSQLMLQTACNITEWRRYETSVGGTCLCSESYSRDDWKEIWASVDILS
jgi:hypothetical protein